MCIESCKLLSSLNKKNKDTQKYAMLLHSISVQRGNSKHAVCKSNLPDFVLMNTLDSQEEKAPQSSLSPECCDSVLLTTLPNKKDNNEHILYYTRGGLQEMYSPDERQQILYWIILPYLHQSLVCPPHRKHPWPALQINDYSAA